MTEAAGSQDSGACEDQVPAYSKDYWDNVFEQVGRRPMAKLALVVLALLYASAIYAPLIANDRPWSLEAADSRAYRRDLKTLYASSLTLRRYAKQGREAYLEELEKSTVFRRRATAIAESAAELRSLASELEEGLRQLDPEAAELDWDDLREAVDAALSSEGAPNPDAAGAIRHLARQLNAEVLAAFGRVRPTSSQREKNSKLLAAGERMARLLTTPEEEYLAQEEAAGRFRTFETAVREEQAAFNGFLRTCRDYLPPEDHAPFDALEEKAAREVDLTLAGRLDEAAALASEVKDEAKRLRREYQAKDPTDPDSEGLDLVPKKSWPLFESTTSIEVFFMWLWAWLLTWPLWNRLVNRLVLSGDRERIRSWRKVKRRVVLGSSLAVALVWHFAVGGQMTFASSTYKEELTTGELILADPSTSVEFPPIALGFAENHTDEINRPPTWLSGSEIDQEGHYVRGPRAPEADPMTGLLPPAKPVEVRYGERARNDALRHPLGTDSMGRDLLVRLLYGGRISLTVGILSTVLLVLIGVVMGSLAGYFGGRVDILISRVIEIFQSFPAFFLILTAVALIPDDKIHPIFAIVFFIAIVRWTGVARLVRGEFLRLKEQDFVMAARALGLSSRRVIFRHVLPNAMGPVLVAAAFSVAAGILTESGISFLGLGIKAPIPSWGSVLNDSRGSSEFWWMQVFPGLLIFVTVFCYNVVGEGVRDALDPKRKVN